MSAATAHDILNWYASTVRQTRPEPERERRRIWDMFAAFLDGRPVSACRPADALAFIDSRPSLKSDWSRKRWLTTIQRPFNHAARLGLIPSNPFWGLQLPSGGEGRDWTRREFQAALRHCAAYFRRLLIFMRWTGARPGEMRAARVADVDFDIGALILSDHKTKRAARGRPRIIYLNRVGLSLVRWLMLHGDGEHLFVNGAGRPWTRSALTKHFRAVRRRSGLRDGVVLHGCRHSFASGAIVNGLDLATVAELLGHASVTATARYVHLARRTEHLRQAVARAVRIVG